MTVPLRKESTGSKFGDADYAVFVLMLVASVLIGIFSAVRNGRRVTINDYLLGGRSMPPFAVALSLLGGWISAISVLGKEHHCMIVMVVRNNEYHPDESALPMKDPGNKDAGGVRYTLRQSLVISLFKVTVGDRFTYIYR